MKTAIACDDDDAIRRALLQRIANGLAVARLLAKPEDARWDDPDVWWDDEHQFFWPCCWVTYGTWTRTNGFAIFGGGGRDYSWFHSVEVPKQHRICPDDCPHWHHQREELIAYA